jgi:hypothetical protein
MGTADLVGQIYESIGDNDALEDAMKLLARISDSRGAQFGLRDSSGRWDTVRTGGVRSRCASVVFESLCTGGHASEVRVSSPQPKIILPFLP